MPNSRDRTATATASEGALSGPERAAARLRTPTAIAAGGALAVYSWLVLQAPVDAAQGIVQKILYVHPPLAFAAYLGFIITGAAGVLYLWKGREEYDRLAISSAEVGVLFCTLMMITGPIWAKGTWGKWWAWDPRLTVTLLMWFVYLAYLLLRSFGDRTARTARFASVYGVLGVVLIPLNYYVIEIFQGRGMHPENLDRDSLGAGMGLPFFVSIVTTIVVFVHLLVRRWEVEALRAGEAFELAEAESAGEYA